MAKINKKLTAAKTTLDQRMHHLDINMKDAVERIDIARKNEEKSK